MACCMRSLIRKNSRLLWASSVPGSVFQLQFLVQALATALRHPAALGRQAENRCVRVSLMEELPAPRGRRRPSQEDLALEGSGESGAITLQQR